MKVHLFMSNFKRVTTLNYTFSPKQTGEMVRFMLRHSFYLIILKPLNVQYLPDLLKYLLKDYRFRFL